MSGYYYSIGSPGEFPDSGNQVNLGKFRAAPGYCRANFKRCDGDPKNRLFGSVKDRFGKV
jgi:hypothetical protein